jgi:hypothetical protein
MTKKLKEQQQEEGGSLRAAILALVEAYEAKTGYLVVGLDITQGQPRKIKLRIS